MRARSPDHQGFVDSDGISIGYEVFGEGKTTILLMPTWTIIHSRFWKMQIPYLSRYYRVITYDGPGNGRSERVTDPARYSSDSYAADAAAVLDECGVEKAVVVGLSLGAQYTVRLAALHPDRVTAIVLVGAALPLAPPSPERAGVLEGLFGKLPADPKGWEKYSVAYWHHQYQDFAEFFFDQVFSEPYSTKPIEDAAGWALETGPDVLEAEANRRPLGIRGSDVFAGVNCPTMVIHGTRDRIHPHAVGVEAARLTNGTLVTMEGSGHMPNVRDPVRFNLVVREFVEGFAT